MGGGAVLRYPPGLKLFQGRIDIYSGQRQTSIVEPSEYFAQLGNDLLKLKLVLHGFHLVPPLHNAFLRRKRQMAVGDFRVNCRLSNMFRPPASQFAAVASSLPISCWNREIVGLVGFSEPKPWLAPPRLSRAGGFCRRMAWTGRPHRRGARPDRFGPHIP